MLTTKKNLWLIPDHICIIRGNAVALNLMFETKKDHKLFFKLWDKYLGGMTEVINYHLSPTDWTIMFRTKTSNEIIRSYLDLRKRSRKANPKYTYHDPKRMISEHIRIFLSQFVKQTNALNGRKGTKVLERFHKYILKTHADYQRIFRYISNQERVAVQRKVRYRADERTYDLANEIQNDGLLRVGKKMYEGIGRVIGGSLGVLGSMRLIESNDPVLRHFFNDYNPPEKNFNSS